MGALPCNNRVQESGAWHRGQHAKLANVRCVDDVPTSSIADRGSHLRGLMSQDEAKLAKSVADTLCDPMAAVGGARATAHRKDRI